MEEFEINIVDTETAGLGGGVCEIAYMRLDEWGRLIGEPFSRRLNPGRPIEARAQEIHGISDEMVADLPTLADAMTGSTPIYWIGHNASFDQRVCAPTLQAAKTVCTLKLARQYFPQAPNHRLDTLREYLGLSQQKAHSALGDIINTHELLTHVLDFTGLSLLTLFERQTQPRLLAKMPFGKHKGMPMTLVPRDYREWMLSEEIDNDLRFTLTQLKDV